MILVTGGTGLVGAHLLLKLVASDEKVRAIHRAENLKKVLQVFSYYHNKLEAERLFNKIEWVKADILDIPALTIAFSGVEKVYHCAALVSFNVSDEKKLRKINIEGTANIVNLSIFSKVKKLCYVSSIATLNQEVNAVEITEESAWNPEIGHRTYAISKYGAEMEVWRGTQEGLPAIIVNPGVILGPGNWKSGSGMIFSKIKKGLIFHFPQIMGFVGVQDVVRAMLQLMNGQIKNEQYILVSENRSFKDILFQVAYSMQKKPPTVALQPWMLRVAWIWQVMGSIFGNKRELTSNSISKFFGKSYYSSEKIKEQLNFQFEPMDKVISETADFFKTEK